MKNRYAVHDLWTYLIKIGMDCVKNSSYGRFNVCRFPEVFVCVCVVVCVSVCLCFPLYVWLHVRVCLVRLYMVVWVCVCVQACGHVGNKGPPLPVRACLD